MEKDKGLPARMGGKVLIWIVIIATLISVFFFIRLIIDSFTFR